MRRIVVGFDGSSESRDALRLARMFAEPTGAELVVAAVFAPVAYPVAVDLRPAEAEYFADAFGKAKSELGKLDFVPRELSQVSAPRGLNDLADEEGADMIVIGSTHRGALGRVLPGSVGERLLNGAPCAVAVAPRGFARGEHFGLGLIGVAYDGTDEAELALRQAGELVERLDGELRLITIVPELSASPARGPYMDVLRQHYSEAQERALNGLGESVEVDAVLEQGDPAAILARHGVELDLLVIGSRGYGPLRRTLLGGVSAELMRTAPCPVLIVSRAAKAHLDETEGERLADAPAGGGGHPW